MRKNKDEAVWRLVNEIGPVHSYSGTVFMIFPDYFHETWRAGWFDKNETPRFVGEGDTLLQAVEIAADAIRNWQKSCYTSVLR